MTEESAAIPEAAKKPQDRKPKKSAAARKAEADGFAAIEVCGITLRIDMSNLSVKALMLFDGLNDDLTEMGPEDKKVAELKGFRLLLGPDQWAALLDRNPGTRDFEEIGKQFSALAGNQSASSPGSTSTATR